MSEQKTSRRKTKNPKPVEVKPVVVAPENNSDIVELTAIKKGLENMLQASLNDVDKHKSKISQLENLNTTLSREIREARELLSKISSEKEVFERKLNSIPNWIKKLFI